MSKFSRPSDWLRQLFIPSTTGWRPPARVSEEVSLTQPYDGGGYPIWPVGQWVIEQTFTDQAAGSVVILLLPDNEICRLLAASIEIDGGVIPTARLLLGDASNRFVGISDEVTPSALNIQNSFDVRTPIIPPGGDFRGEWEGGDAATDVTFRAVICRCPLGSVFYV